MTCSTGTSIHLQIARLLLQIFHPSMSLLHLSHAQFSHKHTIPTSGHSLFIRLDIYSLVHRTITPLDSGHVNGLETALAFSVVEVKSHRRREREKEMMMMRGERALYLDSVSLACIHRIKAPALMVDKAGGMTRAGVVVTVQVYLAC